VSNDTLNRLSISEDTTLLDVAISDETFSVLIAIFIIGFIISLSILIYYRTGILEMDSLFRVNVFLYLFIGLILIGLLIIIALTWSASLDIKTYLNTPENIEDITDLSSNKFNTSLSYLNISLLLAVVALLFTFVVLVSTFA
jgi:RsiW-degrading membrane proteinase PrsW (M82 family)